MDLIKDRLAHILRAKNLTATQFAEMMQIQPSNVSHLLSGRNKPSLDFLIKLKALFPEYNFDWIILGKKPITCSDSNLIQNNSLFEQIEDTNSMELHLSDNHSNLNSERLNHIDISKEGSPLVSYNYEGLRQIIYVYADHTFEIYNIRE